MNGAKIFLSYRREDSEGQTGRLYDRLNAAWPGRVFMDVSGISLGVDFIREIERAMTESAVVIPVIGRHWINVQDKQGQPRLNDPDDPVRFEITLALKKDKRILPVLVDGASMPEEEQLPSPLRPLHRINALAVSPGTYDHDIQRLIDALTQTVGQPQEPAGPSRTDRLERAREMRQNAEIAIARQDWSAAVQALQAAVSLDPEDAAAAARLRWAQEQQRAVAKPAKPWKWVLGTLGAVLFGLMLLGFYLDEQESDSPHSEPSNYVDGNPAPVVDVPAESTNAPARGKDLAPNADPNPRPAAGALGYLRNFRPAGVWRLTSQVNPAWSMILRLSRDHTFLVQSITGGFQAGGSAGSWNYDSHAGTITFSGRNNLGIPFQEHVEILEAHDEHYHAFYNMNRWDMHRQ